MTRLAAAGALASLAVLAAAVPARADTAVAQLTRDTPVAAYGATVAWSAFDQASGRHRLMMRTPAGTAPAAVATSAAAFDVSLGPDAGGRIVALYTRCTPGCDVFRYDVLARREVRLRSVSSPREDEAWPTQWGSRVAFVRRHPTGGRGEIRQCDVPFVRDVGSARPSRRLDRGSCGRAEGLSIRGTRIIEVTFGSPPGTRFASQVRRLSAAGGAVRVLAAQTSGEESNEFASATQSTSSVFVTRVGVHPTPAFVRIDAATGRRTEVAARTGLVGPAARDERGVFWYVEGPGRRSDDDCGEAVPVPCRLVRASASPFSSVPRTLTPRLTISAPSDAQVPGPLWTDPFVLAGRLTRSVVARGALLRDDPVAGVALELLARVADPAAPGLHEAFAPTGTTATTGADGRWSVTLPDPPSKPWFSAVTRGPGVPTYAGRGTVGTVSARITMTVSGTSFAGTVTPAQPGRTVLIQRLASRRCQTAAGGQQFCQDSWDDVAAAPLSVSGTAFAAAVAAPAPGTYRAALPFSPDDGPRTYAGGSPDTVVG
jgi:hypothetical protein